LSVRPRLRPAYFAFGVAGLYLQKLLPEPHTSNRSRDMIAAILGLISLLLALVLGTLVGSAYNFYSTQKSEMETFAGPPPGRRRASLLSTCGSSLIVCCRLKDSALFHRAIAPDALKHSVV
jgi:hypothetical protein